MLRFVLSIFALAALMPVQASAIGSPEYPLDVLDPTPRRVTLEFDGDGTVGVGLFNRALNGAVFNNNPPVGLIGGSLPLFNLAGTPTPGAPATGTSTGMQIPFDPTPLAPNSGDETWGTEAAQTVFGLNCDVSGLGGAARATSLWVPDGCLLTNGGGDPANANFFYDPNFGPPTAAGGGDPFLTLGYDGYTPAGFDPNDPTLGDPNYPIPASADVRYSALTGGAMVGANAVGPLANPFRVPLFGNNASAFGAGAGLGLEALVPIFHQAWSNPATNINPDPNGAPLPVGAVSPSPTFASNGVWNFSKKTNFAAGAQWASDGSTGTITIGADQIQDMLSVITGGSLFEDTPDGPASYLPFVDTDPGYTAGIPGLGIDDPNVGPVPQDPFSRCVGFGAFDPNTLTAPCVAALVPTPNNFGILDINTVGPLGYDPNTFNIADPNTYVVQTFDPNGALWTIPFGNETRACLLSNPNPLGDVGRHRPVTGLGCLDTNFVQFVPLLNPTNEAYGFLPWEDFIISIDVRDPNTNSNFGHATITGQGTTYNGFTGISAYTQFGSTQPGPWLLDTNEGYSRDIPTNPPGDPNNCEPVGGDADPNTTPCVGGVQSNTNFFSLAALDYFCATDGSLTTVNDPTTLGFGGEADQANGSDGYIIGSSEVPVKLTTNPCHELQVIPYDVATGVLRMLGPNFWGSIGLNSGDGFFNLNTVGLREVPEPGTGLLLGIGLAGLAYMRRRGRST